MHISCTKCCVIIVASECYWRRTTRFLIVGWYLTSHLRSDQAVYGLTGWIQLTVLLYRYRPMPPSVLLTSFHIYLLPMFYNALETIYFRLISTYITSHHCCETFIGCGLQNASTSSWLCSFTNALHGLLPRYLYDHIPLVTDFNLQRIQGTRLSTVGNHMFLVARCCIWNSLPLDVTSASALTVYHNSL